jgi:hypothetical protein
MRKIFFILLLFTSCVFAQFVQPLIDDTTNSGTYNVNSRKILGTKNDATHSRMPVDAYIEGPITGSATSTKQDSLLNVNKNMRSWLAALMTYTDGLEKKIDSLKFVMTNGLLVNSPYRPSYTWVDSLAHSGGAHVDTTIFNPAGNYGALTLYIKARASADTLTIKMKSTASRLIWGTYGFGLKDLWTLTPEPDNTTVIISANVNRRFLITVPRGQYVLICRKVTNSVNRANSIQLALEGSNL